MTWEEFYQDRVGSEAYKRHVERTYEEHIKAIARNARDSEPVIEIGAGIGTITRCLMSHIYNGPFRFVASDISREMCSLMRAGFLADLKVLVLQHDARVPLMSPGGVVHSHGLLEHFSDEDIGAILASHSSARVQVHYVPGERHREPSFGDERLLPIDYWMDTFKPSRAVVFNEGKDYCLIFKN